jgi:uncharacterized protein YkwD
MTRRRGFRVAAAPIAALFLLAAACAAGVSANKRSPGVIENGEFKPTLAPVANYGPDPKLACPTHGVNGLVDEEVASVAKPDGRLCAVADTLLGWEGEQTPPEGVLTTISSDFGLPQTVRKMVLTQMETAEESSKAQTTGAQPKDVAASLSAPIRTFAASAKVPRYGLMTQRIKKGVTKIVLVMQDQTVDIQPLPRKLSPGQSATLSGTVAGGLSNPKVQYTDAVGKLEQPKPEPGKSFRAELKCGNRPGRILVQISGEQEGGGDVLLANFAVGCGVDLPVAAALPAAGGKAAATTDPGAGEKQLGEMVNKDRTTAGLKPLRLDEDLAKVARSLSEDRAKGKGTTSEELQRRMKELDISAPVLLVSEAQTFGAEEAHTRFTNSPQDRSNEMNPGMTHLGIGIAPGPTVNDRPMIIVTELFMKQLPPPDAEEVKTNLYKAIQQRRTDARAGALAKDPQLEEIAQAYASEMAKDKGQVPKARVAEIEAPLYKGFATVNEIGGVKADPLEFAQEAGIVGDAKLVGVGVGIGSSPQFGKNSTFVVILTGKKHGAAKAVKQPVKKQPAKK